jgi:hypothetical protein
MHDARTAIGRRRLCLAALAAGCGLGVGAAAPVPPTTGLNFRIVRHGSPIGTHSVVFTHAGEGDFDVRVAVEAHVSFGPIPLVAYTHRSHESWRGGKIVALEGQTDRNGKHLWMAAERGAAGLQVRGNGTEPYIAPEDALPTTYWTSRLLQVPMIGTQDGGLVHPHVAPAGTETLASADGPLRAHRFDLSGDLVFALWYDMDSVWAGMQFSAADGSIVHYERL